MKRILSLLFALILISALCFNVCAEENDEWHYNYEEGYLEHNGMSYKHYWRYAIEHKPPTSLWPGVGWIKIGNYNYLIRVSSDCEDIVFLQPDSANPFQGYRSYTTKKGYSILSNFLEGKYCKASIYRENLYNYEIPLDFFERLNTKYEEARSGTDIEAYEKAIEPSTDPYLYIIVYGEVDSLYRNYGYIYLENSEFYYSAPEGGFFKVDDEYLVKAIKLEDEELEDLQPILDEMVRASDLSKTFVVGGSILGIVFPALPLILSLVLIFLPKTRAKRKRWLCLTALSALLILTSIAILLIWFL